MKKTTVKTKLVLLKETTRALLKADLGLAGAGHADDMVTQIARTCPEPLHDGK
jgi:hypothetical protein